MEKNSLDIGSRFLSSSLHEIRTPIQTIISTLELLKDTPLTTEQMEYIRQLDFSSNVMLQLANSVLDFTKMRSKEFHLEKIPFNLIETIERTVDLISIDAFNKGIEVITDIDYSIPHIIKGDQLRLQQVILNLVKNAVKFTSKGYIKINVKEKDNFLHFEIIDSGIGIPEEKRKLIFKNYYQVDASTSRMYGGTGLGLSISSLLVKKMGGKIKIKGNKPQGSNFYFSLPLEGSQSLLSPEEEVLEGQEKKVFSIPENTKILIVDDNNFFCQTFKSKLEYFNFKKIECAHSGQEALEKLQKAQSEKENFTLLFVDMIMPEMDGWRFASQINNFENLKSITKYLMIPEGQLGSDAKMKMLDWFKGYIYKPIKYSPLCNVLGESFSSLNDLKNTATPISAQTENADDFEELEELPEVPPAENMKILIAEDHPVNRKLMKIFLEKFGAQVFQAENGQEAVDTCLENPDIDLVFMDIQMPVKNGADASVELREKNFTGIIIACTANSNQDDFAEYKRLGINDILVKPFRQEEIKKLLEKWNTVLLIPEAKQILSVTSISSIEGDSWDSAAFRNMCQAEKLDCKKIIESFIESSATTLNEVKALLSESIPDYDSIQVNACLLEKVASQVKEKKLKKSAHEMIQFCKEKNKIMIEACRTNYALDLHAFTKLAKNWLELEEKNQVEK